MINENFINHKWQSSPYLFQNLKGNISEFEIFKGLFKIKEDVISGSVNRVRFFEGLGLRQFDYGEVFPTDEANLSEFLNNLEKNYKNYTLVLSGFANISPVARDLYLNAFKPLLKNIGLPEDIVSTIFISTNQWTPFGVHVDKDETFYMNIKGRKKVYLWDYSYNTENFCGWSTNPAFGSFKFFDHLKNARTYEIEAGECVYIPKNHWHVVENLSETYSLAYSIGLPKPSMSLFEIALKKEMTGIELTFPPVKICSNTKELLNLQEILDKKIPHTITVSDAVIEKYIGMVLNHISHNGIREEKDLGNEFIWCRYKDKIIIKEANKTVSIKNSRRVERKLLELVAGF